jgi:hypothetical protein
MLRRVGIECLGFGECFIVKCLNCKLKDLAKYCVKSVIGDVYIHDSVEGQTRAPRPLIAPRIKNHISTVLFSAGRNTVPGIRMWKRTWQIIAPWVMLTWEEYKLRDLMEQQCFQNSN